MKKHPILFGELIGLGLMIGGFVLFGITSLDLFLVIMLLGIAGILFSPFVYFITKMIRNNEELNDRSELNCETESINKRNKMNANFFGFVLLSDSRWNKEQLEKDLKLDWNLDISKANCSDNSNITFRVGDMVASVSFMDATVPDVARIAKYNYMWAEASEKVQEHCAHLVVSVMGVAKESVRECGVLFSKLMASCCKPTNVVGVDVNEMILEPLSYINNANNAIKNKKVPVHNLIWFGLYKNEKGVCGYTKGMNAFGKEEMEVLYVNAAPIEVKKLLVTMATYVLEYDVALRDGETIGFSPEKQHSIILSKGISIPGMTLKISYDSESKVEINNKEDKKVSEDRDKDICMIICELFKITLPEAERLYRNAIKITDLDNCIFVKIFDNENLIIDISTKEFLYCKYPILFEKFVNLYKEGKRGNDSNIILEEKIKILEESKIKEIKEKSIIDGVDYMYVINWGDNEDEEEDYDEPNINDITDEKTLFMFIVEGENNGWGYFDGDLENELTILHHKCCTLSVAMLVYKRVKEWAYEDEVEEDSKYYKFLFELYNDIKNFKYEIGELLPNIKIGNVDGKLYYDYPEYEFDSDFDESCYDIPSFEKEENEFNIFFNYLKMEVEKNIENSNDTIQNVKNQLKVDKNDILNLECSNKDKMVDNYLKEDYDIGEIKNNLRKKAIGFETGGIRPTNELGESWIGKVAWQLQGEIWPTGEDGEKMIPLATIFLDGSECVPDSLKNIKMINIFLDNCLLNYLEEWNHEIGNYEKWFKIYMYKSLDNLVKCEYISDKLRPFPLVPHRLYNEFPRYDELNNELSTIIDKMERTGKIESYDLDIYEECDCIFHKIGGYPNSIRHDVEFDAGYEFVLKITSDGKAGLNIYDDGNFYFGYNQTSKDWQIRCDYYID